jgi:hypothetical protein
MLNYKLPNFEYNNEIQNLEMCFFSLFQPNKNGENFGMKIRMNWLFKSTFQMQSKLCKPNNEGS